MSKNSFQEGDGSSAPGRQRSIHSEITGLPTGERGVQAGQSSSLTPRVTQRVAVRGLGMLKNKQDTLLPPASGQEEARATAQSVVGSGDTVTGSAVTGGDSKVREGDHAGSAGGKGEAHPVDGGAVRASAATPGSGRDERDEGPQTASGGGTRDGGRSSGGIGGNPPEERGIAAAGDGGDGEPREPERAGARADGGNLFPREEQLGSARQILRTLVDVHESNYTEVSAIIAAYSGDETRKAMRLLSDELINTHDALSRKDIFNDAAITRTTVQGTFHLVVDAASIWVDFEGRNSERFVRNQFSTIPITPLDEHIAEVTGFGDSLFEERVILFRLEHDQAYIDKYRTILRGARWTAAVLLNWDSERIPMPEDLH